MTLQEYYRLASETPSDINQHIPCLRRLAEQCEYVTEFGVREGVSTTALLSGAIHGKLRRVTSYDPVLTIAVKELKKIAYPGTFLFIARSSLVLPIVETDMLFIDSLHTYQQLKEELLHSPRVRRWIVLHDTLTYGNCDEGIVEGPGLLRAIKEFLDSHLDWCVSEHYPFNNGLTVLEKNNASFRYGALSHL